MFFQNFPAHLLIPILALLIPIVAIVARYLGRANSERLRHETIRELARAGQPIPPELLADAQESGWSHDLRDKANPKPNRTLLTAAVNVGTGLGLMGMFAVMSPGSWLWAIGLLPLFLGLCLALYWAVERKQQPQP